MQPNRVAWYQIPPLDFVSEVLVPGEPERLSRAERSANGIPIDRETFDQLLTAGVTLGLARADALAIAGVG